ncbi:putative kynurenine 3-monooxygenase protein [Botrytis fragariae]|uniref:Kynurenine 3-monooxygenase n=1 Tax=Botrytis fragariae TaxID=1964551 RepID=A0A8H6B3P0_9HELO|nr:putative kynurenine 3-monooxygenase protein [Botrytis fragariae]KAF5878876.1 putative kynurenine 3-monooxygenase protein [Botrytis fragariae]
MPEQSSRQKTVIIGAGPVGALAALYAAQRGDDVEIYELRSDLRDPSTTPLNFTKSINLALSERGINAIRQSGRTALLDSIMKEAIPMGGRMIHGETVNKELYEQSQDYDIHGRSIYAVDRGDLNKRLLDELESLPNVKFKFNHKLTGADFRNKKAWFEVHGGKSLQWSVEIRDQEVEVDFDFLVGADGAHSATRYHLMKYLRMDYQQEYIDTLWCEFTIDAQKQTGEDPASRFKISPHHLHIWPGKDFMFIAIPSTDGSFTCTLFMPSRPFNELETDPKNVPAFFDEHFPGVTKLIDHASLISSFKNNPHLPLISIKCKPYHFQDSVVILGDAAHAMVPFYGQGMNAGLEDVRVLYSVLDDEKRNFPLLSTEACRSVALGVYSEVRKADAHAINDLAFENYFEMRAAVISPVYKFRKWLEETLSVYVPRLGWQTKYSRVSFSNERYSEIVTKSQKQGKLIIVGLVSVLTSPIVIGGLLAYYRWRRAHAPTRGFMKHVARLGALLGWKTA